MSSTHLYLLNDLFITGIRIANLRVLIFIKRILYSKDCKLISQSGGAADDKNETSDILLKRYRLL